MLDDAVSVSVLVALPPATGVTATGESAAVNPLGRPDTLRLVPELYPLRLPTVIVLVALAPGFIDTAAGDALSEKSGEGPVDDTAKMRSSDSS